MSVRRVLGMVAGVLFAGQLALGGVVWWRQSAVGFGGKAWTDVVLAKDLEADVLPPPAYLVDPGLGPARQP